MSRVPVPDADRCLAEAKAVVADLEVAVAHALAVRLLEDGDARMTPILVVQGNRVSVFWPTPTTEASKLESHALADALRRSATEAFATASWSKSGAGKDS